MVALIWKTVDLIKSAKAGDINGALTVLLAWAVAVGAVFLYAQTDWADGISIGTTVLSSLNGWSLLAAGLALGSGAGAAVDIKQAIDSSDSNVKPHLIDSAPVREARVQRVIE